MTSLTITAKIGMKERVGIEDAPIQSASQISDAMRPV